jgi:hypothetical protein
MNKLILCSAFTMLVAMAASADDFVGRARVVKVVTLPGEIVATRDTCRIVKPRPEDLVATLRWDLCTPPEPQPDPITRYRVYYEWDDQVYERVVDARPGPTVPVRVRLD